MLTSECPLKFQIELLKTISHGLEPLFQVELLKTGRETTLQPACLLLRVLLLFPIYTYIHTYTYMYIYIYLFTCLSIYTYVSLSLSLYIYIYA